ncbi:MAG TPA: NAD-dependent epimerase/dehydratase family protein [Thermoanaerobaculia bacterium]|jgi:nucleoside-diphosphate-sugar epimerase|nr:NAD-dependent epimerase/dehydratase family protein [Thermoanaerobaculia bacterium]
MNWNVKNVLVTGGASFISSHLIDHLVEKGARSIRVVDDLSSGRLANIQSHIDSGIVEFHQADLLDPGVPQRMVKGMDVVFHLAAIHGGRGFVDLHQAACAQNLAMDGMLVKAAYEAGVEKFVFASSGCVYPNHLQGDVRQELYLSEEMVGPPYDADNMYGWAKLMTEMTLRAYARDFGFKSASCRFFTVYGERGVENHAVIAMIARAFVRQNPFEVWGDGTQIRNWTYVGDIVRGMALAAEKIDDGTAVNLGTEERTRVIDAVREVLRYTGHEAEIKLLPHMPTGPLNRVARNGLARELLGWEPRMKFMDGLHRTIDWYFGSREREAVSGYLEEMLTER